MAFISGTKCVNHNQKDDVVIRQVSDEDYSALFTSLKGLIDVKYSTAIRRKIGCSLLWMVVCFFPLPRWFACVSQSVFCPVFSALPAFSQKRPELIVVLWVTTNCLCSSYVFSCIFLDLFAFISTRTAYQLTLWPTVHLRFRCFKIDTVFLVCCPIILFFSSS